MPGGDADQPLRRRGAALARRWANQRLEAVEAYGRIIADYGAGRMTTRAAAGAYARLVVKETVSYSSDAVGLLSSLTTALVESAGGGKSAAAPGGASTVQDLELSAPAGGVASASVVLHNPHDRPATLSFVAGPFVGPTGELSIRPAVEPPKVELAPRSEQAVTVSAAVDAAVFEPGRNYTSNIAILGFDDLVLRVRLSALPT